ncbi:MAG: hypothetical protein SGJ05_00255 [bacterium]|nr:hypothetical protein [bacterium]
MVISTNDIETISSVLGKPESQAPNCWFWNIRNVDTKAVLALTISSGVDVGGGEPATIVAAQTHQGYIELHDVTGFLFIEPDEVMFITKSDETFSCLVVGASCTCSQFANVRVALLKADLTEIDPVALMAAMQLQLAESLLETLP